MDAYDLAGNLLARVAQHGQLNAPWGLALAPSTFGRFAGDLLVGNFGDGQINAYAELGNGHFAHRGELRDSSGKSLSIDGLWALQFGQGGNNGPAGTLFFTAGPDDETHGLFGQILGGWRADYVLAGELQDQVGCLDRPGARLQASRRLAEPRPLRGE